MSNDKARKWLTPQIKEDVIFADWFWKIIQKNSLKFIGQKSHCYLGL